MTTLGTVMTRDILRVQDPDLRERQIRSQVLNQFQMQLPAGIDRCHIRGSDRLADLGYVGTSTRCLAMGLLKNFPFLSSSDSERDRIDSVVALLTRCVTVDNVVESIFSKVGA